MALILVIDDSRIVRVALELAFRKDGHDVIGLGSITKLKETLEREQPDVIVLDLLMPDFSVAELARLMEGLTAHPPPIIVHSGSALATARIVARAIHPFDVVRKGDSEVQLRDAVTRALEGRPLAAPSD